MRPSKLGEEGTAATPAEPGVCRPEAMHPLRDL